MSLRARQAAHAGGVLEVMHAVAHHFDAALNRSALRLIETCGDSDDPLHMAHQIVLGWQRPSREPPREFLRKRCRFALCRSPLPQTAAEPEGLVGGQRRLILNGVGKSGTTGRRSSQESAVPAAAAELSAQNVRDTCGRM